MHRNKVYRRDGGRYTVSPYGLIWNNENYYLVAYDDAAGGIRHYRVDRMDGLNVSDAPRTGRQEFDRLDMSVYTHRMFNMFRGKEEVVHLRLPEHMAGLVMDAFGHDVPMMRGENGSLIARITVAVSPQFYGWVFGLGSEAEITAPAHIREEYRQLLCKGAEQHQANG